jgi:hypothetical protein
MRWENTNHKFPLWCKCKNTKNQASSHTNIRRSKIKNQDSKRRYTILLTPIFQLCSKIISGISNFPPPNNFSNFVPMFHWTILTFDSIPSADLHTHQFLSHTKIMILSNLWFSSIGRPPNCKPHTDITKLANLQFYSTRCTSKLQILLGIASNGNKRNGSWSHRT